MAPQEKNEIVDQLESGRAELIAAVSSMTEEQARTKPAPDRWSVLECMEHVNLVENRFRGMVEQSEVRDAAAPDKAREQVIVGRVLDRTTKRNAPEAIHPTGKYTSVVEALEQFNAVRDRTVQFAQEQGPRLYGRSAAHPVFGTLNGAEALLLIAGHGRRHTAQMREAAAGN
jgi:hypothetical protein